MSGSGESVQRSFCWLRTIENDEKIFAKRNAEKEFAVKWDLLGSFSFWFVQFEIAMPFPFSECILAPAKMPPANHLCVETLLWHQTGTKSKWKSKTHTIPSNKRKMFKIEIGAALMKMAGGNWSIVNSVERTFKWANRRVLFFNLRRFAGVRKCTVRRPAE